MAFIHAPWWRRVPGQPATFLFCAALLPLPRCMPLALQVSAQTFFEEEMRVVLPKESACQIFCYGVIEEDVTSFRLTYLTEGA